MNDILKIAALIAVLFVGYKVFYKHEGLGAGGSGSAHVAGKPIHASKIDVIAAKQAYDKAQKRQTELETGGGPADEHRRALISKASAKTAEAKKYYAETLAAYKSGGGR